MQIEHEAVEGGPGEDAEEFGAVFDIDEGGIETVFEYIDMDTKKATLGAAFLMSEFRAKF